MNGTKKLDDDEILYLDEINDEVSRPLTSTNTEAEAPFIGLRAGFVSENDENLANPQGPDSVTVAESDGLDKKPSAPIGFDSRNGPGLPVGTQSDWSSNIFPPAPAVQVVTPDVNIYQHKKTLAQGMMDLALLSANANQMRYVLQADKSTGRHPYFYPSLVMISMSLFLQIAVGIGLIWNSVYNVKEHEQMCKANKANNWTVIGIFLVTILNVFISSFGVVDQTVSVTT
ncbi:PREDICTED: ninjurin-1-like [Trachymyrmex cornetzi]|uniref:Ninjurin-1 n=1 Tax=Trachymyrmex cornetzi TaxID=471704 RepID=A0A151J0U5_9HYME|nr:PREDICTED: ninjurin-1-like [Trachymyrmex cornetzi]XP_018369273.1 PREDICTED: ninjurin-1-like [Trachymyrmex cornetzi]XP_018369274.1 PREDICTED: ninjurin-1-like [Trachymyrmex cornetzi]XP_018369275.1 PREDICTED: ninjurin-1-like [Trachymyrmex cornetzi]XP_018369276.1 PREDICTED: ninjurin-1-like [Trachymyrmex cornetzi]KYN15236.1 Ninjurin-1 [Trachymyrmex cornetzi]